MAAKSPFLHCDRAELIHPPRTIAEFVRVITAGCPATTRDMDERRTGTRYLVSFIAEVQPLDDNFRPAGELLTVVTHDISADGIAFHTNRPIDNNYIAVQLTQPGGETLLTVMEVVRHRPLDHLVEIGGKFVTNGA